MKRIYDEKSIKGVLECDHESFMVFKKDVISVNVPEGRYTKGHDCPKIEVYRAFLKLNRVYVIKGELKDKILENAKNKKEQKPKIEEA